MTAGWVNDPQVALTTLQQITPVNWNSKVNRDLYVSVKPMTADNNIQPILVDFFKKNVKIEWHLSGRETDLYKSGLDNLTMALPLNVEELLICLAWFVCVLLITAFSNYS